jgi:gamma-glutamyltranspeptidase/glutathione hydrolase
MRPLAPLLAAALLAATPSARWEPQPRPAPALARHAMVATEQHDATQAGLDILRQGGNAVDAAIAVAYALAVVDPCCGNIGGGGFMLVRMHDGRERFIDFREAAPGRATPGMYLDARGRVVPYRSTKGWLAIGVPGTVAGMEAARISGRRGARNRALRALTWAKNAGV